VPYERGQFRFSKQDPEEFVRKQYGFKDKVPMIEIEKLMTITGKEWNDNFRGNAMDVSRFYLSAFLLAYYFIHMDDEGKGRAIWEYLRAIESAKTSNDLEGTNRILLRGRSYEELYKDMQRAFKRENIQLITF